MRMEIATEAFQAAAAIAVERLLEMAMLAGEMRREMREREEEDEDE